MAPNGSGISRQLGSYSWTIGFGSFAAYTQQDGVITEVCFVDSPVLSSDDVWTLSTIAFTVVATYPLQLIIGIMCIRMLIRARSKSRKAKVLICHVVALEVTNTVGFLCAAITFGMYIGTGEGLFQELGPLWRGFIKTCDELETYRGPVAQFINWTIKINTLNVVSNVAFICTGILTDAMLIWRCRQIWKFTLFRRPNLIIVAPITLGLADTVLAILIFCIDRYSDTVAMLYFATSLALNLSLTILIVTRLLKCKVEAQKVLGNNHGKHYNLVSTLFIESALMNAICSILLLAFYAFSLSLIGLPPVIFNVFISITPAVQTCANYLIIYRGAQGFYGGWSDKSSKDNHHMSSVAFQNTRASLASEDSDTGL